MPTHLVQNVAALKVAYCLGGRQKAQRGVVCRIQIRGSKNKVGGTPQCARLESIPFPFLPVVLEKNLVGALPKIEQALVFGQSDTKRTGAYRFGHRPPSILW